MHRKVTRAAGVVAVIGATAYIACVCSVLAEGPEGHEIPPVIQSTCLSVLMVLTLLSAVGWYVDRALAEHREIVTEELHRAVNEEFGPWMERAIAHGRGRVADEIAGVVEHVGERLMNKGYSRGYTARGVAQVPTQALPQVVGSNVLKLNRDQ